MTIKTKIFQTIDTETCGLKPHNTVYDIGYTIHDKRGNIFAQRNWLVRDIITDADKMMGAFYAKKIFSYYIPALDSGKVKLADWSEIAAQMTADILTYGVDVIAAYNAGFDLAAIRATSQATGYTKAIVPHPVDRLCIWAAACQTLLNRPTYHRAAAAHGWISDAGNVRTTAEHTFRYLTGQPDFIESHTALDDALIETFILSQVFRQKKPIPYNDFSGTWQRAQKCA